MKVIYAKVSRLRQQRGVLIQLDKMVPRPIVKHLKVPTRVHSTEDGVSASIVAHPVERHEPDVRCAHDPLPKVVDAVVNVDRQVPVWVFEWPLAQVSVVLVIVPRRLPKEVLWMLIRS